MGIYRVSALLELATGIALLLFPGFVLKLIFQNEPDQVDAALSQLCGIGLVSLSLATGAITPKESGSSSANGLIFYNLGVAFLFIALSTSGIGKGLMFWPIVALHALIGGLMVLTRLRTD